MNQNSSRFVRFAVSGLIGVSALLNCGGEPGPTYSREATKAKYHRPTAVQEPADNKSNADRIALGKALFFDPRLSRAGTVSCGSCHNPSFSWGDGLAKGVGHNHKELGRRTPTILNTAFGELYFWDGRASSLEEQALGPIASTGEMNMPLEEMVAKLQAITGYKPLFEKAYPGEGVTSQTVAKAIASFERTVISEPAPFDRWISGDEKAISDSAKRGFDLFNTKANCASCHTGWNFTDDGFHDIGVADEDVGRGKLLPQVEVMQHAFKTPTLRNVDGRRPFLHNGSEASLEDVMHFYNGGGKAHRTSVSSDVKALNLSQQEMDDICNFMRTLTSEDKPVTLPILPR